MTIEERRRQEIYDQILAEWVAVHGFSERIARHAALQAMYLWGQEVGNRRFAAGSHDATSRMQNRPGDGDMGG